MQRQFEQNRKKDTTNFSSNASNFYGYGNKD